MGFNVGDRVVMTYENGKELIEVRGAIQELVANGIDADFRQVFISRDNPHEHPGMPWMTYEDEILHEAEYDLLKSLQEVT